jgi:transcriptional regulator with XRE-family HTH domain
MPKTVFTGAHKHVVEILASARKEAGLTQTQLGDRIGRDQSFISLIEGGQRRVDVLEFFVLARALGYEPLELVNRLLARLDGNFEI